MMIADSCYSGTLTRSSIGQLESGVSTEALPKWMQAIVRARVRTVLTSGGVQPVLDAGGGKHSVFAQSLLEVLAQNEDTPEAQRLYREVAARMLDRASRSRVEQRPEYAPMKFAGHESGDFLFVPTTLSRALTLRRRGNPTTSGSPFGPKSDVLPHACDHHMTSVLYFVERSARVKRKVSAHNESRQARLARTHS